MKFQNISQGSDTDDDMYDLSKPVHSLSHYVDDETELVSQMFSALKFKKIKAMLPPVLRNSPMADIQRLFAQELSGMSRTRILASINGGEVDTSSSDSDLSDSQFDITSGDSASESKPDGFTLSNIPKSSPDDLPPIPNEESGSNLAKELADSKGDTSNLTALDLIELEMRAKLIKTMLEKQPNEDIDEALENLMNVNIKKEPMSPELLAGIVKKEKITPENSPSRLSRSSSYSSSSSNRRSGSMDRRQRKRKLISKKKRSIDKRQRRSMDSDESQNSSDRSRSSSWKSEKKRIKRTMSCSSTSSSTTTTSGDSGQKYFSEEGKAKKKLTRKEFEERMKKAKMNRSYRKRDDSDEDSLAEDDDVKRKKYKKWKAKMQKKLDEKAAHWQKEYFEGLKKETEIKNADKEKRDADMDEEMEEGEVMEKEDGEIESNEEEAENIEKEPPIIEEEQEEGACSSSDHQNNDAETKLDENNSKIEQSKESLSNEKISNYSEKVSRRRSRKSRKSRRRQVPVDEEKYSDETIQLDANDDSQPKEETIEELVEDSSDDNSEPIVNMTLPIKSERQSISFSLLKKNLSVVQGSEENVNEQDNNDSDGERNIHRHFAPNENIEIIGEDEDIKFTESWELEESPSKPEPSPKPSTPEEHKDISSSELEVTGREKSAENSGDSNFDIIGCVAATGDKHSDSFDEELISGSSWSTRWLQSEKVQTVVSDSKILSKVRKKIQAKGKIEKPLVISAAPQPMPQPVEVQRPVKSGSLIGSLEEYEKVVGVKVTKAPVARKLPAGLDSGDSEDSEEEALWSQIMKK